MQTLLNTWCHGMFIYVICIDISIFNHVFLFSTGPHVLLFFSWYTCIVIFSQYSCIVIFSWYSCIVIFHLVLMYCYFPAGTHVLEWVVLYCCQSPSTTQVFCLDYVEKGQVIEPTVVTVEQGLPFCARESQVIIINPFI